MPQDHTHIQGRPPLLLNVAQNPVQLIQAIVGNNHLAATLCAVLYQHSRTEAL